MKSEGPGRKYEAIVIGAGHNGLVTAAYLAKAGYRTLVVERRPLLGGAAASEEIFPGFKVDTGSFDAGLFRPEILADLNLVNKDLEFIESPAIAFAPQPDSRSLTIWEDRARTQKELARFSQQDAHRYPDFLQLLEKMASLVASTMTLTPPTIPEYRFAELIPWLKVALKLKRFGKQEMMEFLRVVPMPVADFLDEWFESPALKGLLGSVGVLGSLQGPRASGTAFMLLYQATAGGVIGYRGRRSVRGGMGQLAEALAAAARRRGADILTGTGVNQIVLQNERAVGVTLETGEQISARVIISNSNPRHTFFDLVGADKLEVQFVREVKNIRYRGCLGRVILALDGLPRFKAMTSETSEESQRLSSRITICPDLDYLERAYDEAKYGSFSRQPYLDIAIPTILDPSLAPPGKHLMLINIQYAPYHLAEGDWTQQQEALGKAVIEALEAYAPGIRDLIIHSLVLTPLDLEKRFGLPEGCIFHGQMGLDQLLFMRPVPGYGRYRTPIENLFLCGAGTHPGGGVTGAPGYNAAREVIRDLKSRRDDR